MRQRWQHGSMAGLMAGLALLASGCGAPPTPLSGLNASYESALSRTAPLAVTLDSESGQRAFENLQRYFDGMTLASVREQTVRVYAPESYLNDTLVGIDGVDSIEAYFLYTVKNAELLTVEFLDRAPVGTDWYVRWRMTVAVDGLNGGKPVVSYGVTQFRFDADGRVLLHKDFWDAGTGLYEQLPVLGALVGRVRAAVESGGEERTP
ncbi:MAG: nuclear transport factor 2 family protein [Gammaproteobacteria bacterium]|nr:nuclear transport factor 2 family protein [Gammaproteobacteria bacterium]